MKCVRACPVESLAAWRRFQNRKPEVKDTSALPPNVQKFSPTDGRMLFGRFLAACGVDDICLDVTEEVMRKVVTPLMTYTLRRGGIVVRLLRWLPLLTAGRLLRSVRTEAEAVRSLRYPLSRR